MNLGLSLILIIGLVVVTECGVTGGDGRPQFAPRRRRNRRAATEAAKRRGTGRSA